MENFRRKISRMVGLTLKTNYKNMRPRLQEQYREICNKYVKLFCEKHKVEFEHWVSNEVGRIANFGDIYFFGMSDIAEDLDNNYPEGLILKWIEDVVEYSESFKYTIPLNRYVDGERYEVEVNTKEDWQYIQSRIKQEGLHYCFKHYSDFDEIKDKMFHNHRQWYIEYADRLEKYINDKIESYE